VEYRAGYAEARRAFLIGQALRERRLALGLSQVELAAALDAELIVEIVPHAA
jgi:hypothetical protein